MLAAASLAIAGCGGAPPPRTAPLGGPGTITVALSGRFGGVHDVESAYVVADGVRFDLVRAEGSGPRRRMVRFRAAPGPHHLALHLQVAAPCHPGGSEVATLRRSRDIVVTERPAAITIHLVRAGVFDDPEARFEIDWLLSGATLAREVESAPEDEHPRCGPAPDWPGYPERPGPNEELLDRPR